MEKFDLKITPEGIKDYRGPSLDSEDSYFLKLHQHLSPNIQVEEPLMQNYNSPSDPKNKISNSHSDLLLQSEYNKMSEPNFSKRKMTKDIREQLHYDNLRPDTKVYDETRSTLELDYSLLDPDEPLIIDKGIMKFHPGFSINYVSRWVQVTKTVIRFYKNYYHSVCNFRKPLAVIPLSAIGKIKTVKLAVPKNSTTRNKRRNPYDSHQFEIVLNEEYEAIYDLNRRKKEVEDLKYELELILKLEYQNKLRKKYKRYRNKCRLSKSPLPTFKIFMEERKESIQKCSKSNPRCSFSSRFYEEDISKFDTIMNKSQEICNPVINY